ncbi:MAG: 30S ribosome-binding factor RbfA [Acidobacteria bacterium]|nr:30S ribosome-binding factor RbfA [Acidobacteriota bacterium]
MNARLEPICEQVREIISRAIAFEMRDPAFEGVTITRVRVSPDYQFADVRYTTYDDEDRELAEAGFQRARGALRSAVAKQINMRKTPQLRFHYDEDVVAERRISDILEGLKEDSPNVEA